MFKAYFMNPPIKKWKAYNIKKEYIDNLPKEIQMKIFKMCLEEDPLAKHRIEDPLRVEYASRYFNDTNIKYEYYNNCISEYNKQRLNKIGINLKPFNNKTVKNPFPMDYLKSICDSIDQNDETLIYSKYKFIHDYYQTIKYDPSKGYTINLNIICSCIIQGLEMNVMKCFLLILRI